MGNISQASKNIELSEKLAKYIADDNAVAAILPKVSSFVAFSSTDKELNEMNDEIVNNLLDEGEIVVKAEETKNKKNPFRLTVLAPI